jgi:hypothetical protein
MAPTPLHLSRQQFVSLSKSSCVSPVLLIHGIEGGGGGEGAKSKNGEDAVPSKNNLMLSVWHARRHAGVRIDIKQLVMSCASF